MVSRSRAGAVPIIVALVLLGTAGLAGCSLIENGNGREAFREAYVNSFYDPTYESIFTDPPYEFESLGGDTGVLDEPGMNGSGGPAPYPDTSGEETPPDAGSLPGDDPGSGVYEDDGSSAQFVLNH